MKKVVSLLWFLVVSMGCLLAVEQNTSLTGTWKLEKCILQKDSAGVVSMIDYRPSDGNIPRWYIYTELTIGEDQSCSIRLSNNIEKGKYRIEGDTLILDLIIVIPVYQYAFENDSTLILKRRHYLYNKSRPERGFIDIGMYYTNKSKENEN